MRTDLNGELAVGVGVEGIHFSPELSFSHLKPSLLSKVGPWQATHCLSKHLVSKIMSV